jgi:hypothetical protein
MFLPLVSSSFSQVEKQGTESGVVLSENSFINDFEKFKVFVSFEV